MALWGHEFISEKAQSSLKGRIVCQLVLAWNIRNSIPCFHFAYCPWELNSPLRAGVSCCHPQHEIWERKTRPQGINTDEPCPRSSCLALLLLSRRPPKPSFELSHSPGSDSSKMLQHIPWISAQSHRTCPRSNSDLATGPRVLPPRASLRPVSQFWGLGFSLVPGAWVSVLET